MRIPSSRRRFPLVAAFSLLSIGLITGGCSDQGAASQAADAPIKVETSQMYVTVRNDTGMALNEVTVGILPMGRTTTYTEYIGRVENAETRRVMLGDFNGRDGTPFSLRVVRPRTVQVKGTDVTGKSHETEVPWK